MRTATQPGASATALPIFGLGAAANPAMNLQPTFSLNTQAPVVKTMSAAQTIPSKSTSAFASLVKDVQAQKVAAAKKPQTAADAMRKQIEEKARILGGGPVPTPPSAEPLPDAPTPGVNVQEATGGAQLHLLGLGLLAVALYFKFFR